MKFNRKSNNSICTKMMNYILNIDITKKFIYNIIETDLNIEDLRWVKNKELYPNPYINNTYLYDGNFSIKNFGDNIYVFTEIGNEDFIQIDIPDFSNPTIVQYGNNMIFLKNKHDNWLILDKEKEIKNDK